MSIVFYEEQYCKELLEQGTKEISQRELNYVAKYFRQEKKISDNELRLKLEEF